jgi:hypothetical protein
MGSLLCLKTFEDVFDATQLAMDTSGAHTWKLAIFDSSLVIDVETFTAYGVAPFNAGEASGGGYSAGGATFTPTWQIQAGSQRLRWNSSLVTIANVTDVFRYLLHYDDTLAGNNAFYVCDLGGDVSAVAETVNFTPGANGWFRLRGLRASA